jgi:hypothetical protein
MRATIMMTPPYTFEGILDRDDSRDDGYEDGWYTTNGNDLEAFVVIICVWLI